MDIQSQLQDAYLGNLYEIRINSETSKAITLSDICVMIGMDEINERLILDKDITDYTSPLSCHYSNNIPVTKDFENMQIVLMLYIICATHIGSGYYFSRYSDRIKFDCSEFLEVAEHFGVKHDSITKKIVGMLSGRRFGVDPDPDADRNAKIYLGLVQAPKSARNVM